MSNDIKKKIDLQGVLCPVNFVRTKLALEELDTGELLEAVLDEGEPMLNVPRSLRRRGIGLSRWSRAKVKHSGLSLRKDKEDR